MTPDDLRAYGLRLIMSCPYFAPIVSRLKWVIDDTGATPTASISLQGVMRANPKWLSTLEPEERPYIIAHECGHLLYDTFGRQGRRDPRMWNIATDMAINRRLNALPSLQQPKGHKLLVAEDDAPAEELYARLQQQQQSGKKPKQGEGDGEFGRGCGVGDDGTPQPGEGDQDGDAAEGLSGMSEDQLRQVWREAAATSRTIAENTRRAGTESAAIDAFVGLTAVPAARVPFASLIRSQSAQAIAGIGRDDWTWGKRGRRSGNGDFLFPGWTGKRPNLAVVIDSSGSMSDEDVSVCCKQAAAASRALAVGIYLVIHDAAVGWSGWLHGNVTPQRVAASVNVRGGTAFAPAYRNVGEVRVGGSSVKFDGLIHLTDGGLCEPVWPERPENCKKLIVGLVNDAQCAVPEGTTLVKIVI